ncbi:hypothetical protein KY285_030513 [Solanum tuberosum]|nr:hypothetical protein KY289_030638 [Solanum tuberosum]KAH0655631.1 hypothetical protein KY285_030513 [Solanum tuberosum]
MRDMKGKLEDADRTVRNHEIAKQPLEIFNHMQDTLSPNATLPTKARNQETFPKGGDQLANLPPQEIRPQMRSQHNLEEHDSLDGDNYSYGIDDQAQLERLGGI